ncbi:MAG: hypothetical protein GY758_04190 [Fuerstiella sp.]|nr:hypothetical protein [Fuerstiella sp.]
MKYRGYTITYDPPPIPIRAHDWQFAHDEYDGPEDTRIGYAKSLTDAMHEVDEQIAEDEENDE